MEGSVNTMNDLAQSGKMIRLLPEPCTNPHYPQNSKGEARASPNAARDGRGKALRRHDMFEPGQRLLRVPPWLQDRVTML